MTASVKVSNVREENGSEAIKLTSTLNSSPDGGASEVLQAVLNSASTSDESSGRHDDVTSVADSANISTAASIEKKFGWWNLAESAALQLNTEDFYRQHDKNY
jgi:hypothetical protein